MRTESVCLAVLLATEAAAAQPESECVSAYEEGQRARNAQDLTGAREQFRRCAKSDCPPVAQSDCGEWLREVEKQIPTLILSARWSSGADIVRARVLLDDKVVSERLDGRPLAVNPGEHTLRLEVEGQSSEQRVVANQGEHDRVVRFTLTALTRPPPKRVASPPEPSSGPGPLPFALGGVAVLALGGFSYFAIKGRSDVSTLRESCAPYCSQASLDHAKRELLVADILLGTAVVSAGAATYLFLNAEPRREGAVVSVGGRF